MATKGEIASTAPTLSDFKELVRALEKSKNYIEEHELLSEEELNVLKQTSSLVAKFQKEALAERENRISLELQAQEKERLVSDAWKIVTALKKDKYDLETQLEKLKKHRSASNMDRPLKDSSSNQVITKKKAELSQRENSTKTTKKTMPKESDFQMSTDVTPSSSTESKEKQDSIKESSELSDNDSLMEDIRCILADDSSSELEEGEVRPRVIQDISSKHHSPSDMIKLFTAKPYLQPKNNQEYTTELTKFDPHCTKEDYVLTRSSKATRSPEEGKLTAAGKPNKPSFKRYKSNTHESIHVDVEGCSVNVEVDIPKLSLDEDSENTEDTECIARQTPTRSYDLQFAKDKGGLRRIDKLDGLRKLRISPRNEASNKRTSKSPEECEKTYGAFVHNSSRATDDFGKEQAIPSFDTKQGYCIISSDDEQHVKMVPIASYDSDRVHASVSAARKETPTNSANGPKSYGLKPTSFKAKESGYLYTEEMEKYGRHAPKVVSPLIKNNCLSNDATRYDLKGLRKELTEENLKKFEKQQIKSAEVKLSKTNSDTKIKDESSSSPRGIVSKRIQDLAKILRVGNSRKNFKRTPYSDSVDYRNPSPGVCGLENLGNSCFMNAGLQCLFVVKPFYRFFLEGEHIDILQSKIRNDKSLRLCELLGRLIDKVFSGCYLTCEASALFTSLQMHFPQLDGFIQHDCQEFLALFLDALHQELNTAQTHHRRRSRGRSISGAKTADQWWRLYKEDNESVIVDAFQGQFRNKIRCAVCNHVSITYQAFTFLSLPLLSQKCQTFVITLVRNNDPEATKNGKPRAVRLRVQVCKPSTTIQIKQRIVSLFPVHEQPDSDNLFLAVVRDGAILGLLHDQRVINPFNDKHTKLYAYEPLHPPTNSSQEKPLKTTQFFRRKITSDLHDTSRPIVTETNTKLAPLGDGSKASSIKGSYSSSTKGVAKTRASFPIGYHLTYTCSICVQAKPIKQLLQHYECGKVFCLECLEVSLPDDNVHCPDCLRPSSTGDAQEIKLQYCNVPVVFRNKESDEGESTLFGHPNLVTLPCKITGQDLYQHMATLLPGNLNANKSRAIESFPFSLHLVDYQGTRCSRCDDSCTGCCIEQDNVLIFENGDHLAIQLNNIIQLEVDKMSRYCDHESMRVKHLTCKLQLQDCLRSFVDREQLEDLWKCPECNQERSATKSMSICRYPDTLIIHLKRYRQSYMKIYTPVEFPLEDLDMNEFMHGINSPRDGIYSGENTYDLTGIVCHEGDFESGHYKAYSRNDTGSEWHLFDDYRVSQELPSSACHMTAYLLFYTRRANSSASASIKENLVSMKQRISDRFGRRRSGSKPKSEENQNGKRNASTKTKQNMLLPSKGGNTEDVETVMTTSHPALRDLVVPSKVDKDLSSTPKESVPREHNISKELKEKCLSERDNYKDISFDTASDQPAHCDCSQCDYYRELEQQIRRCRRSVSSSENKGSSVASSRGVSPKTRQPKTSPVKHATPTALQDSDAQIHKEKTPQLASSDSLGSELLPNDDKKTKRHSKRRSSHQQQHNTTSSSSNSEQPTRRGSANKESKVKEIDTDVSGVTDSAIQCTLMDDDTTNKRRSTRSNAVQVSLVIDHDEAEKTQKDDISAALGEALDHEDKKYMTMQLIHAVKSEDMKQAIQLLEEGADPCIVVDGITPLHIAAGMKSSLGFHFTRLFLDYGANPNVRSAEGLTPVHVASVWGKKECLKLLLKKGGNPYAEDAEGRTAVDLANNYEFETSANTSEYLNKLDHHYTSMIHSQTCSNTSLTSEMSASEYDYMPYIHGEYGEGDYRSRRVRRHLEEIAGAASEASTGGSLVGCGSWTKNFKRRVKRNKVVRTMSGNLRKNSSRLADRFRSFSDHFSSHSSDNN